MMNSPTLAHTQRLLRKLITAAEGAAAGVAQLGAADGAIADALVRGDTRLSALERIDIYADMYFYRLRDALQEDFPAVHAVIGAAHFHNLVTDYLLRHPPAHFSLRYAGQRLPAFLDAHLLSQRWPYAADLARLEWAILDAFDAPDAPPLDAAVLSSVPQECWPTLRFQLSPSLQLLQLRWPVHELWQRVQHEEALPELQDQETALRVWRQELRVFHRPIDAAESAALHALRAGATFAEVCEQIAAYESDGAERAAGLLREWLADGLLTGFSLDVAT